MERSISIGVSADHENVPEGTSTLDVARAIHRASWVHNPGRTITDIPFFDNLSVPAQVLLCDSAYVVEMICDRYADEDSDLLEWNVAEALFGVYLNHPLSSEGAADWISAPRDLKHYWKNLARSAIEEYRLKKDKKRAEPWWESVKMESM